MPHVRLAALLSVLSLAALGCSEPGIPQPPLRRSDANAPRLILPHQHWPDTAEREAVGPIEQRIRRGAPGFGRLAEAQGSLAVFKDEEGTGADRLMTPELRDRLGRLAHLVAREWPGVRIRVTEAWDEDGEHGMNSVHYEGRAADVTTSDRDVRKLARLAGLAVRAGFGWVSNERTHVHASVSMSR